MSYVRSSLFFNLYPWGSRCCVYCQVFFSIAIPFVVDVVCNIKFFFSILIPCVVDVVCNLNLLCSGCSMRCPVYFQSWSLAQWMSCVMSSLFFNFHPLCSRCCVSYCQVFFSIFIPFVVDIVCNIKFFFSILIPFVVDVVRNVQSFFSILIPCVVGVVFIVQFYFLSKSLV